MAIVDAISPGIVLFDGHCSLGYSWYAYLCLWVHVVVRSLDSTQLLKNCVSMAKTLAVQ